MLKVESRITEEGILSVYLLNGKTVVGCAIFPVNLLTEMGTALMLCREKLEAEGIIKPDPLEHQAPGSEAWS